VPISKANKLNKFMAAAEIDGIAKVLKTHILKEEKMEDPTENFALALMRKEDGSFEISEQLEKVLEEDAFLLYFDPSP